MSSRRCGFCGQTGHYRTTCPMRLEAMNITADIVPIELDEESSDIHIIELGTLQELLEEPEFNTNTPSFIVEMPSVGVETRIIDVQMPSVEEQMPSVQVDMTSIREHVAVCPICMEDITTQPKTELECTHSFCTKCIMANLEHGNLVCPLCRDDIMGPSKKIVELNHIIDSQHSDLCDQDAQIDLFEIKCRSYESNIETQEKKYNDMQDVLLTGLEMDSIDEVKHFTHNISSMYKNYKDTQVESGVCASTVPKISDMIYSSFSTKRVSHTSIPIIKDSNQHIMEHDSWVKILGGKYRNYMARVIWVPDYNIDAPSNIYNGTFIIRVYMGLGKPKLGKGIYDRSYTNDIKFHITDKDSPFYAGTSLYGGTPGNTLICPQMLKIIPNCTITYKINGNATKLPVEIKSLLNRGDMEIILQREP